MSEEKTSIMPVAKTDVPAGKVHPLVSAALSAGSITPETIRELLTLQKEWEADEARKAYTRDMAAAKTELPAVIGCDKENARLGSRYATLAKVLDETTVILARYGFSIGGNVSSKDGTLLVSTNLTHRQGHRESITLPCKPEGIKSRDGRSVLSNEQVLGKTITYLRRYGLSCLLGLSSGDMPDPDDDNQDAVNTARNQKAVAKLAVLGVELAEAEKKVGRPWKEWIGEDLKTLAEWMNKEPSDECNI
jgi:hypothetical protein